MAISAPIDVPEILTNRHWQKNKGLLAKAAGETGVGSQMDKVQVAFKAVDWSKFYAKTVCATQNGVTLPSHVLAKLKDVTGEYGSKVEALRKEVDKLAKLAEGTAADWKKSKTVPAASAKHAQAVADAASTFHLALKGNGVYFTQVAADFEQERLRLQRNVDIARNGIRGKIASLKKDAGDVIANPTPEQFKGTASAGFYQRIRGIGADLAALSEDPRIEQIRQQWLGFSKAGYLPKSAEDVKPKVKEVLSKVGELEKLLG